MFGVLVVDETFNHAAPNAFGEIGIEACGLTVPPDLGDDVIDARRVADLVFLRLDARRLLYIAGAFGEQRDEPAIEPVDLFAYFVHGSAFAHGGLSDGAVAKVAGTSPHDKRYLAQTS